MDIALTAFQTVSLPFWGCREFDMGKFLKEKWIEILIVVIILPGFAGLWWLGWGLNDRIIRQEVRTDSIVAALPDLRTRTAFESVYKPFVSVVMVSKPYLVDGVWYTSAYLLDAKNGKLQTFDKAVASAEDMKLAWSITGSVMSVDKRAVSFGDMEKMAVELKHAAFAPNFVDPGNSYVLYEKADQLEPLLKELGLSIKKTAEIKDTSTWSALVSAVKEGIIKQPK